MPALPWTANTAVDPMQEYLVMASRLPLRSYATIPAFLRMTLALRKQLAASERMVGYSPLAEPLSKSFWTLSAWSDEVHRPGPHRGVSYRSPGPRRRSACSTHPELG
jgi:hypothetical protein